MKVLNKFFGSRNDRVVKKIAKRVAKVNALESIYQELSDEEITSKTIEFKERISKGGSLDSILPEAFAIVREAGKRVLGMRHYDVQIIGGIVLHSGKIAEMRTGEGKTLVATLPVYLNALTGNGVHVITVNDYLASRDAEQMGELYNFLGLTTGVVVANIATDVRRAAYACDITYGTNNEFGFDYLRDNMAFSQEEQVQRSRNFVVIDEVDSILIDEARTPLIISGAADDSSELYVLFNKLIPKLDKRENEEGPGDYYLDEKSKQAYLTEDGHTKIEMLLVQEGVLNEGDNLYSPQHVTKMHYLNASLRAHTLYEVNVDYMISAKQEVVIVDEHTGRAMEGRRWSDGLHQAMEAKEGVEIQGENQTLASITFQNFFKLYNKISGMTGTADTEAFEFQSTYDLEVVLIPTNLTPKRKDHKDMIYLTQKEKYEALILDIQDRVKKGQPILVGTASIDTSEILSTLMRKKNIKHNLLNAKQHEREAGIIAQAGYPGAVTIATNMAGRGTDIILGGNWLVEYSLLDNPTEQDRLAIKSKWAARNSAVKEAGGLCILGSERHDSRRIDNQLRGRAGRQGDPGESRFYLSLEDNLVRIFAPDRMANMLRKLGMGAGEAIESGMVTKSIAKAQSKVETYHFDIRKNLLEYDDVSNDQRQVIYTQREELLASDDVSDILDGMREDVSENLALSFIPPQSMEEQWDIEGLEAALVSDFDMNLGLKEMLKDESIELFDETLRSKVVVDIVESYKAKTKDLEPSGIRNFERVVILQSLDNHWREHLNNIEHLRNSVNLRGYAQKNPKQEYKREAFDLFSTMLDEFKYDVIGTLAKVKVDNSEDTEVVEEQWRNSVNKLDFQHESVLGETYEESQTQKDSGDTTLNPQRPYSREGEKIRRNDSCPCGSGKKYKHCHGSLSKVSL
jgi:preprotein translocase subunit SecA